MYSLLVLTEKNISNKLIKRTEKFFSFNFEKTSKNNMLSAFNSELKIRINCKNDYMKFFVLDSENTTNSINRIQMFFDNEIKNEISGVFIEDDKNCEIYSSLKDVIPKELFIH